MRFMGFEGGKREGRTLFIVLFTGYLHGPALLIVFYVMQKVKSLIC